MNHKLNIRVVVFMVATIVYGCRMCLPAWAQEKAAVDHAAVLAPFVSDDTFVAISIDLAAIDPAALITQLGPALNVPQPEQQQAQMMAAGVKGVVDGLRQAGVTRIYVVMGLGDISARGGPVAIIPLAAGAREATARQQIQSLVSLAQNFIPGNLGVIRVDRHTSGAIMVGSNAAIDRYAVFLANERADITAPLARLANDGASFAVVTAPGVDARRVIRELWPQLPPPASALTSTLLADRLRYTEMGLKLSPNVAAHIAFETTDPESAAAIMKAIADGREFLERASNKPEVEIFTSVANSIDLRIDNTRVVLQLPSDNAKLTAVGKALNTAIDRSRERTRINARVSTVKKLGIAFATYEASRRSYPPAAIRDAEGKPLLSWRVALLPHLDQQGLYAQFHLNEPWDSPHNIALVKRMPTLFADPDPKYAALARDGKTMWQVPVGPETIFYKNEGTKLSEIKDGTAMTISVVEVVPERAVEWTKPADWEVNMQNPLDGVRRSDRDAFTTGFVDSHAEYMRTSVDPDTFRALLTRAAGDAVNPQK